MFNYEPDDMTPEEARAKLLKIIKVSVGIDLLLVVLNLGVILLWARQGGGFLILAGIQAIFLIVSGRSFLTGLDEIARVKRIKVN